MRILSVLLLLVLFFALNSCQNSSQSENIAKTAYLPLKNDYANHFSIEKSDSNSIIFKTFSTNGKQAIYHVGNWEKSYLSNDTFYINNNIKKIICLSTLYASYLEKVNSLEAVVGIDNVKYVYNPLLRKQVELGTVKEVGETGSLNIEKILTSKPDLIITYGDESSANPFKKLTDNNIPVLYMYDFLENHPLGRTEWLKIFGILTNKDSIARKNYEQIKNSYHLLKEKTKNVTQKPTVFFEIALADVWYIPGGASYLSNLASDAGANYIWNNNNETGSLKLSIEQVIQKAYQADFWLHQHYTQSLNDLAKQNKKYIVFEAFKNKRLYNNTLQVNTTGGNAFWETGLIQADSLLADAIKIFHPDILPQHKLVYYKKLE